jgi:hypothetical protein
MTKQSIMTDGDVYGTGVRLTSQDDDGLKAFCAFLSLSRSGRALVSNVAATDDGKRILLVYVRTIDGELACTGVQLADDISRKAVVKMMRDAGVQVENLPGKIEVGRVSIN